MDRQKYDHLGWRQARLFEYRRAILRGSSGTAHPTSSHNPSTASTFTAPYSSASAYATPSSDTGASPAFAAPYPPTAPVACVAGYQMHRGVATR